MGKVRIQRNLPVTKGIYSSSGKNKMAEARNHQNERQRNSDVMCVYIYYVEEPTRHVAVVTVITPVSIYKKYNCSTSERLNKTYNSELSDKRFPLT